MFEMIFLAILGTAAGIYIGAIPGLSVTMAVSLLISLTYSFDTYSAIAVMIGVYVGGVYGGSRAAIMLNIPGAPAAVATTFDGYPLAKKGEASQAIGISTVMSVIGGFIGVFILLVAAPIISDFALKFGAQEYLIVALIGLMLVGSISAKSISKGWFMAAIGVLISCVGIDPLTGQERLTFGSVYLKGGINYIVVMIGLFSLSEIFFQLQHKGAATIKQKVDKIRPDKDKILKYLPCCFTSSIIGTLIGALPGTGGEIAALISYDVAKRTTKNPVTPFGEGAYEGVVAPESANNAAIGGALIPMLTLGIPGDAVTAVLIGALQIHGIKAGPMLMSSSKEIFFTIVFLLLVANTALLFLGLTGIKTFAKLVEIPKEILLPAIAIVSILGSYSINNNINDIYMTLIFGIIGYFFKCFNFPVAPMVLGMILGNTIDVNYRRAVMTSGGVFELFKDILTQPISLSLIIVLGIMLFTQLKLKDKTSVVS